MTFFGLPLYITYEMYTEWLNTYFTFVGAETPSAFIGYLIVIFIQFKLLIFAIEFILRFITLVSNIIKKSKFKGWY